MLIRSLNKEPLHSEMRENGKSGLRMSEGIGRDCYLRVIIEFFFKEMQAQLEILDDVIVMAASLIMFNIASS